MEYRIEKDTGALIFKKSAAISIRQLEEKVFELEERCGELENVVKQIKEEWSEINV